MEVDINWLAVIAATLASMLVGAVWFSKVGLLPLWLKLTKLDAKRFEKGSNRALIISALVTLGTAYVLAHVIYISNAFFDNSFLQDAITTSLWVWFGFTATRFLMHNAYEQRPEKLTLVTVGYELASFLVMGLIIGIMH